MTKLLRFGTAMIVGGSLWAMAGCGGEDEAPPPKPYPTSDSYCEGKAKAACSDEFIKDCLVTKDKCVTSLTGQCGSVAGNYRPDAAEACINTISSAYQDGDLAASEQVSIDKECAKVFDGDGVTGESCTSQVQCDLDQGMECIRGKCAVPATKQPGESCKDDGIVCTTGNYCDPTILKCVADEVQDATCDATRPCAKELWCGPAGTCQPKLVDGESCDANHQCASGLCIVTKAATSTEPATSRCGGVHSYAPADPFCETANGT